MQPIKIGIMQGRLINAPNNEEPAPGLIHQSVEAKSFIVKLGMKKDLVQ